MGCGGDCSNRGLQVFDKGNKQIIRSLMRGMADNKDYSNINLNREFSSQITNRGAHMAYLLCVKFWVFI